MAKTLEKEVATFNAKLPELLEHTGKYALVKADEVVDVYDTYGQALEHGYEKFGLDDKFLVKKIAPAEQIASFTRDYVIECRA